MPCRRANATARIKTQRPSDRDTNYFNNEYTTGALSPEGIISGVVLCVVLVESAKGGLALGGYETPILAMRWPCKSGYEIDGRTTGISHLSSDRHGGGRRLRNSTEYQ